LTALILSLSERSVREKGTNDDERTHNDEREPEAYQQRLSNSGNQTQSSGFCDSGERHDAL